MINIWIVIILPSRKIRKNYQTVNLFKAFIVFKGWFIVVLCLVQGKLYVLSHFRWHLASVGHSCASSACAAAWSVRVRFSNVFGAFSFSVACDYVRNLNLKCQWYNANVEWYKGVARMEPRFSAFLVRFLYDRKWTHKGLQCYCLEHVRVALLALKVNLCKNCDSLYYVSTINLFERGKLTCQNTPFDI